MLLRCVDVMGTAAPTVDVRLAGARVEEIGDRLGPRPGEMVIEGGGGALVPGLHDHHLHLLALAAAARSVQCGPPEVGSLAGLASALRRASAVPHAGDWIRGFGYHESVAGELDRFVLDRLEASRPVRVQHRSGQMWILNSEACRQIGIDDPAVVVPAGVERDSTGTPTGRLIRCDAWLRERLPDTGLPDLAGPGAMLSSVGVTGVTDATETNGSAEAGLISDAVGSGRLAQSVVLMGGEDLDGLASPPEGSRVTIGPRKVVLHDHDLPGVDQLATIFSVAHGAGRPVAVHCVTRSQLLLTLVALETAGSVPGDRVEHGAITPPEAIPPLSRLGLAVVTQPNFVAERGDAYADDVDPDDLESLYRVGTLRAASVPVGGGTDAPFGRPDPWAAMRAAVERRAPSGRVLGRGERIAPEDALGLFITCPSQPGGARRSVRVGAVADLCLLRLPWREARRCLSAELVSATIVAGSLAYTAP